ncbi:MAG: alpha-ribazole phosphatase family protein [Rhodocyclaceae bacterium]
MQVYLIRHPRPQIAEGVCYGRLDMPAQDVATTAATLRTQLPPHLPVISSPLRRCRELAEALHPSPRFEAQLMEMHFGEWEGLAWDAIPRDALDAWAADLLHHRPPGGESAAVLQARAVACLDTLAAEGVPACIVITHAGVMRALAGHVRHLRIDDWVQLRFDYGECFPLPWPAAD